MTRRGIKLTNTSEVLCNDVADMALLLMLAARLAPAGRRSLCALRRLGAKGHDAADDIDLWQEGRDRRSRSHRNGDCQAMRSCRADGRLLWEDEESLSNDFAYFDAPVKLADWADILIVATPGGPSTEGLISADVLNALGPTGSFINIARGTVVDEPALIKALQERRIASA